MIPIKKIIKIIIGVLLVPILFESCTKYDNPMTDFEEYIQKSDTSVKKKVLFINIEGAVGLEIKKIMPTNIKKLLEHSKYSWTGLSEVNSGDATTWTSLTTGVSFDKHKVENESFIRNTSLDNTQLQIPFFPTIFFQLNKTRPDLKTVTVSSWDPLSQLLLIHANKRIDVSTDAQAKDSIIKQLVTTDPSLALVTFRSVLDAGVSNGFTDQNSSYVAAVNTVDAYIGEIVESLKLREKYSKEDWLVIITSNHGGVNNIYGGSSDKERNIFSMFYHPKYQPIELIGKTLLTERFNSSTKGNAPDPQGIYNIGGVNTDLTIEFHARINPNSAGNYNYGNWNKILGKSRWGIYRQGNNMKIYMTRDGGGAIEEPINNAFSDGKWHSMAVVMQLTSKPSRIVKLYYDGALVRTVDKSDFVGAITDLAAFDIGGSAVDFNIAEIRVWNKALSDFQLSDNACLTEITPAHRDYNNLISYWPAQAEGAKLVNVITGKPDFSISNPTPFTVSSNSLPCDLGASNVNIQNTSVIPQIYYWLGIPINSSWGLDSNAFLSKFELELQ